MVSPINQIFLNATFIIISQFRSLIYAYYNRPSSTLNKHSIIALTRDRDVSLATHLPTMDPGTP